MQMTFVLGVHRSGTSLLTAGLSHVGCALGRFQNHTNPDNPKGEFEHGDVVAFDDRLLAHLGASWDNWGFDATRIDWDAPDLRPWREEAAGILRAAFEGETRAALKDPRMATLLPFWSAVMDDLGWKARHILMLRPPAEVALSQVQRSRRRPHGFPVITDTESMCALWAVTMHAVLRSIGTEPVLVLRHEALYDAPRATIETSAAHLGLDPDPERLDAFEKHHLDASLRRAHVARDAAEGPWHEIARALYDDIVPEGASVLRQGDWGNGFAAKQVRLNAALPLLPAVHRSIGSLRARLDAAPVPAPVPVPDPPARHSLLRRFLRR
ncbi:sulfotransferase family protein [Palleronia sp. LCG004]|uniref:sulfotransferase family protein n=1 Tax=Palleronia sp. LCG004 TaxID=3079304 RepID=UPI002943D53F|nr:sulfotransferase [Palleronia sp. LCG004]WOI58449.1 sulfotransferase [Palleronia sp. LCG004]